MTEAQRRELMTLHEQAVKAWQRWETATPGTKTKRDLETRAKRADAKFAKTLASLVS